MVDSVKVNEGDKYTGVPVAVDEIDGINWPIYKMAKGSEGEATLIDEDNPVPVESLELEARVRVLEVRARDILDINEQMLNQLKIMNTHFAEWDGDENDNN